MSQKKQIKGYVDCHIKISIFLHVRKYVNELNSDFVFFFLFFSI